MVKVLEAVPNFSEGRDLKKIEALVDVILSKDAEVLDWSADPDHNRAVITYIGDPAVVEAASVAAARFAIEHIDMRSHTGVHPRVGALDVLPFVPLEGMDMGEAIASAHRVGREIGLMGLPVFFYGKASESANRRLAELRRGGFEGLNAALSEGLKPDTPPDTESCHPTAGVTCVGARDILLAWNVFATGIQLQDAQEIAADIREQGGGFSGVRALGLYLSEQARVQISMNLEDLVSTHPLDVFEVITEKVTRKGGQISESQVIGMIPDTLVHRTIADRLLLPDLGPARVLSHRVAEHVMERTSGRNKIADRAE